MIRFSSPYQPALARHGEVFSARQYSRQAFADLIDPVINIDWFEMNGPTFPPHPHAGFSAVTYVFADSPNGFVNRDSLGDVVDIRPGGLHWSRASRGMMHEETPVRGKGAARGLQIFVNLPADHQADPAAAFAVPPECVALKSGPGWESRVAVDGTTLGAAPQALPSPVRIEEIQLSPSATMNVDLPAGWGGIVILDGEATAGKTPLTATQAVGFATDATDHLLIATGASDARVVLIMGAQLKQPIYAYGPLMMASPVALESARRTVADLSIPA